MCLHWKQPVRRPCFFFFFWNWQEIVVLLNSLGEDIGAAIKTWKKWRDYWNNRVYDARKKDGDLAAVVRKTGGGRCKVPALSTKNVRILQLAGTDASRGTGGCRPSVITVAATLVSKVNSLFCFVTLHQLARLDCLQRLNQKVPEALL